MTSGGKFEIFPERAVNGEEPTGNYRWRFVASNGAIVATGAEGYSTREHVNRAIHGFLGMVSNPASASAVPHPPIEDVDE